MNRGLSILLMVTILFAGGYFYYTAEAICDAPISYRIGAIAPEFGISLEEAKAAVTDAESLWEDATGRNLFSYNETSEFSINFIYDGRQAATNEEHVLREELEEKKDVSETVREEYERLSAEYNELKDAYEESVRAYEVKLKAHNDEVAMWNEKGGAPEEVYAELGRTQSALGKEQKTLNATANKLNALVKQINELGEQGSVLVDAYNNVVETYNDKFEGEREFTQGDYQGTFINIYQYDSEDELRLVLAHELGHALSIGHVEGEASIMFELMEDQSLVSGLSAEDLSEFQTICGETQLSQLSWIQKMLNRWLGSG